MYGELQERAEHLPVALLKAPRHTLPYRGRRAQDQPGQTLFDMADELANRPGRLSLAESTSIMRTDQCPHTVTRSVDS